MKHATTLVALVLVALASPARGEVVEKTVDYAHGEAELRGYLYFDDAAADPRPGVLVIHEWWGNNDYARSRARQLAAMGYVAFAADMYGPGKITDAGDQAQQWAMPFYQDTDTARGRAQAGLDVLQNHPLTEDQPLAAIGFCFGGSMVLQLAMTNPDRLAGVVSFHGNPAPPQEGDPDPITPAVLICHGAADPFVSQDALDAAVESLRDHGADVTVIEYEGARHSFTNPAADGSFNEGAIYHEAAAKKAWADMQDFFARVFGDKSAR